MELGSPHLLGVHDSAPTFHGLADRHMPHCCCLLDKNQPDYNCPSYSSVPAVSPSRTAPSFLADAEREGDATESRVKASQSMGLSVNKADNISNPSAQSNVQGHSGCFQLEETRSNEVRHLFNAILFIKMLNPFSVSFSPCSVYFCWIDTVLSLSPPSASPMDLSQIHKKNIQQNAICLHRHCMSLCSGKWGVVNGDC